MCKFTLPKIVGIFASLLLLFIVSGANHQIFAASCWVCSANDSCSTGGLCSSSNNCRNVGCNFESGSAGWCDYTSFASTCIQDTSGINGNSCHTNTSTVPGKCWIATATPAPTGSSGACNSGWCTSSADCSSKGGWSSSGAGYCSNATDVQCCGTSGSSTGWVPNCSWDTSKTSYPSCNFGEGNSCSSDPGCNPPYGRCSGCAPGLTGASGACFCPACVPSCTPACGQPDGCKGTCGTTGFNYAGAIATTTPVNNGTVNVPVGGKATISWSAATSATRYDLELYPVGTDCSDPNAICTYTASGGGIVGTTYSFTPATNQYIFFVRGVDAACVATGNPGPWTGPITFSITGSITGTVRNDPTGVAALSGTTCIPSGGANMAVLPGAGSTITTSDAGGVRGTVNVASNGTYSGVGLYKTSTTVTLNPGDVTYACTCPLGCTYGGVIPAKGSLDFFVSQIGGNWFQIMGGDANASGKGSLTFKDPITAMCTAPNCQPYVMIPPTGQTNTQVGGLYSYTSSNIDTSDATGNQNTPVGPVGASFPIKTKSSFACKENFNYFYRLYSFDTNSADDFVAPQNNPNTAAKPTIAPKNQNLDGSSKGAYWRGGDLTINQNWTLGAGESLTILVNGDLNITNGATITVPTSAFLAFIVKGNINIDASIGTTPSSTTAVISGIYVANGNLTVASVGTSPSSDEKKFVGEGSFAACGNISLPRDFRNSPNVAYGLNNNKYPSSLFIYRPDFILNTPDKMKRPLQNWREIAP